MDPLQNVKDATLYNMDCTFLSSVQYHRDGPDSIHLIFSEQPSCPLPRQFYLMPDGENYDYRSFIFTLSDEMQSCCSPLPENKEYFLIHAITDDIPEQRKNFRVYVTFKTTAIAEGESEETRITVKDIGTGGLLFISKRKFDPGTVLSIIFSAMKTPVCISLCIKKQRPIRREGFYGYGCQFINLPAGIESTIRNFVFRTQILQSKTKEAKEEFTYHDFERL